MRDPKVEHFLAALGIDYEYVESVACDSIIFDELENVRLEGVDRSGYSQEKIALYAAAQTRGDQFPAPVLGRCGGRLYIGNGAHRTRGRMKAEFATTDAYIIRIESPHEKRFRFLRARLNVIEDSLGMSTEARIVEAVRAVEAGLTNAKQASEEFGISHDSVSTRLRANRAKTDLEASGAEVNDGDIADTLLAGLAGIPNPDIRKRTFLLLKRHGITVGPGLAIISRVNKAVTEAEKAKILEQEEKNWDSPKGTGGVRIGPQRTRRGAAKPPTSYWLREAQQFRELEAKLRRVRRPPGDRREMAIYQRDGEKLVKALGKELLRVRDLVKRMGR